MIEEQERIDRSETRVGEERLDGGSVSDPVTTHAPLDAAELLRRSLLAHWADLGLCMSDEARVPRGSVSPGGVEVKKRPSKKPTTGASAARLAAAFST
jgi:hypothetical protein